MRGQARTCVRARVKEVRALMMIPKKFDSLTNSLLKNLKNLKLESKKLKKLTQTYACSRMHVRTYVRTYVLYVLRTYIRTRVRAYARTRVRTCARTPVYTPYIRRTCYVRTWHTAYVRPHVHFAYKINGIEAIFGAEPPKKGGPDNPGGGKS